jgi:hypothetical protein
MLGVVIIGKRKAVKRLQPAVLGITSLKRWTQFNHERLLFNHRLIKRRRFGVGLSDILIRPACPPVSMFHHSIQID